MTQCHPGEGTAEACADRHQKAGPMDQHEGGACQCQGGRKAQAFGGPQTENGRAHGPDGCKHGGHPGAAGTDRHGPMHPHPASHPHACCGHQGCDNHGPGPHHGSGYQGGGCQDHGGHGSQSHHGHGPYGQGHNQSQSGLIGDRAIDLLAGAALGAAAAYILSNEQAQRTIMRSAVSLWGSLQGGLEELKERFRDAEAELRHEAEQAGTSTAEAADAGEARFDDTAEPPPETNRA